MKMTMSFISYVAADTPSFSCGVLDTFLLLYGLIWYLVRMTVPKGAADKFVVVQPFPAVRIALSTPQPFRISSTTQTRKPPHSPIARTLSPLRTTVPSWSVICKGTTFGAGICLTSMLRVYITPLGLSSTILGSQVYKSLNYSLATEAFVASTRTGTFHHYPKINHYYFTHFYPPSPTT